MHIHTWYTSLDMDEVTVPTNAGAEMASVQMLLMVLRAYMVVFT
jgi:hypothetical protein